MPKNADVCIPCRKIGLSDSDYETLVRDYVAYIDEDIKTPEPLYQERLEVCSQCSFLQNGLCRLCGCFVMMRAAKIHNRCPDTPAKW